MKMLGSRNHWFFRCSHCQTPLLRKKVVKAMRAAEKPAVEAEILDELERDPEAEWTAWQKQCAEADEYERAWGYWMTTEDLDRIAVEGMWTSESQSERFA
nr:hypothetical protein [Rhodococcus sp. (in: high G+C Gram-positive bacteria)]